jgi:hypothetical protein
MAPVMRTELNAAESASIARYLPNCIAEEPAKKHGFAAKVAIPAEASLRQFANS